MTRENDPVDRLGDIQVPGDPLRRQQCGDGDRQHGDLGRETGPRRQVVQDPSERKFREAAGDEEVTGVVHYDRINPEGPRDCVRPSTVTKRP